MSKVRIYHGDFIADKRSLPLRPRAFSSSAAVNSAIRSRLVLAVCPETISTLLFAMPSNLAKNFINSALAAPSTGGDATRTFKIGSFVPTISVFDALGITRTLNSTPSAVVLISSIFYRTNTRSTTDCSTQMISKTIIAERSNIPTGGIRR